MTLVPAEIVPVVSKSKLGLRVLIEKVLPAFDAARVRLLLLLSLMFTVPVPPVLAARLGLFTLIALLLPIDPVPLLRLMLAAESKLLPVVIEPLPPAVSVSDPVALIGLLMAMAPAVDPAVLNVRFLTAENV